jgi:hypothetical protein
MPPAFRGIAYSQSLAWSVLAPAQALLQILRSNVYFRTTELKWEFARARQNSALIEVSFVRPQAKKMACWARRLELPLPELSAQRRHSAWAAHISWRRKAMVLTLMLALLAMAGSGLPVQANSSSTVRELRAKCSSIAQY